MSLCYDVGDVPIIAAVFATLDGTPTDPSTVALSIKLPDGTEVVYVYGADVIVQRASVGAYSVAYVLTQDARHWWRWDATGAVATAEEGYIDVKASAF